MENPYIKEIAHEKKNVRLEHNLYSDRDLVRELGITDDPLKRDMLFSWMRYQGAYNLKDGYERGRGDLKESLVLSSIMDKIVFGLGYASVLWGIIYLITSIIKMFNTI